MKQTYAFFDFDKTLTKTDTLTGFTKYLMGQKFWWSMTLFMPILLAYKLGIIKQDRAKRLYLHFFIKKYSEKQLIKTGKAYSEEILDSILNANIFERLQWHKTQGHSIYVVTASLKYWIEPWCKKNNVNLFCTDIEMLNGRVTGNILGNNCFGEEKAKRIKALIKSDQSVSIYAYGDSIGDYPMLSLADHAFDCSNNNSSPYQLAKKESWYVG